MAPLDLASLHFAERRVFTLACNWKVFVDNYLDGGYHVPHLHKGLDSILDYNQYTIEIETGDRYCLQSSPIDADSAGGEAMTASVRQGQALYFWLYPNLMLNWYEGYLDTNLVVPLGLDRMQVIFDFYFSDVSPAAAERNRRSMDVSERIQDEDHAICESVQRGLGSRAYQAGPAVGAARGRRAPVPPPAGARSAGAVIVTGTATASAPARAGRRGRCPSSGGRGRRWRA